MNIPAHIVNCIPKDPMHNSYLDHARAAWQRLEMVAEGKIPYIPDDFAALINTLERFYKGFLKTMSDLTDYELPKYPKASNDPEFFLKKDHYLKGLVCEIEKHFINISPAYTKEDKKRHYMFLIDLQKEYTKARYSTEPSVDEFLQVFKFAKLQKETVEEYLEKTFLREEEEEFENNI